MIYSLHPNGILKFEANYNITYLLDLLLNFDKSGIHFLYLQNIKMNPLTNMRNVKKLSEQELQSLPKSSWHDEYKSSAWIFVGGLPYDLSEGDIMAIFSQYGEITNLNLVRDKDTGKQKGFCFICYEDQRSTILAVDNFNGTRILGRILRVDHVKDYKPPKSSEPLSKIKTEKLDNDLQVKREIKTEIKQEVLTPDIKREVCTPEIKREVCTPEIKREICTPEIKREICIPEIIRSPDNNNDKRKKKDKEQKNRKDSRDNYKEKNVHYKHQRDRSKEKDRKKYNISKRDRSREREISNKRARYNHSQERDIISNDLKIKSYKERYNKDSNVKNNSYNRNKASEKDENQFKDDRRLYKNKDYSTKDNRKHHQKNYDSYKR